MSVSKEVETMYKSGVTVWHSVKDVQSSLAFYTEKLKFEVVNVNVEQGTARLKSPSTDFVIGFSESESVVPSTSSTVFEVENIEDAVNNLQQQGLVFHGGIRTIPNYVKLAAFNDPDGHQLMLSETLMSYFG
jgi:predicted enzyme related to lactoylglutathione lyase